MHEMNAIEKIKAVLLRTAPGEKISFREIQDLANISANGSGYRIRSAVSQLSDDGYEFEWLFRYGFRRVPDAVQSDFRITLLNKFPSFDNSWPDEDKLRWLISYRELIKLAA
jgi:hypothetical protein